MRYLIYLVFSFLLIGQLFAQNELSLEPIPSGKARLYVLCATLTGGAVFVDTTCYGRVGTSEYIVLNIDTGSHLIWVGSGTRLRQFIEADLKPGKNYVVNIEKGAGPSFTMMQSINGSSLSLKPRNRANDYEMKKIKKFIRKRKLLNYPEEQLAEMQKKMYWRIKDAQAEYQKFKEKERPVLKLTGSLEL